MNNKKPMLNSTQTEVKISTPIASKISVGVMMLGAFIALFALVFGLYNETYQKPSKEATGAICPDGRITTKCSCGMAARTPSTNYCCSNVYQATACPANELKLWLPFDGNRLDSSGNKNNALCTNCPTYAPGHAGSAADYSGSNYLKVINQAALNLSGAVTLALWLNPDVNGDSTWQEVIASPHSFTAPYVLSYIGSDNSLIISRSESDSLAWKVTGFVTENSWQHVVAGYDAANVPFIYVNGVKRDLTNVAGDPAIIIPEEGDFRIGRRQDNLNGYKGLMDELRIYNKVLSQAEINALAGVLCTPTDPPTEICSDNIDQDCIGGDEICPVCPNGQITTRCLCGGAPFTSGYCCGNSHRDNVCNTPVACEATAGHSCYYMAPAGNDTPPPDGGTLTNPWRTFGYADNYLRAGDYLYIKGGTYDTVSTFEATADSHGGTGPDNKVIVKAYGDSPATFLTSVQVFYINNGANWFTIDGLFNDEIYLIFRATAITRLIGVGTEDHRSPHAISHVTVRGVELDGSQVNVGLPGAPPLVFHFSDYATLERSYIHNFWVPTGTAPGGCCYPTPNTCNNPGIDCSELSNAGVQGGPSCVHVASSDFFLIKNNIVERCNFGGIVVSPAVYWVPKPGGGGDAIYSDYRSKYGKIINNFVDVRYGAGIYLDPADYSLVEGNVETHAGETTTHHKPGIIVSGHHSTVRNNVIYNPGGHGGNSWGIEMHGWQHPSGSDVNNNLVYNNLMFGNNWGSGAIFWLGVDTAKIENNLFANNIVYHNPCARTGCKPYDYDLVLDWGHATVDPSTNQFLGNKFYNNLIRDENDTSTTGMSNTGLILLFKPDWVEQTWSLSGIQDAYPSVWQNNIGGDPLLVSEDPDTHGLNSDWWHIRPGSPAINKGVAIPDTNGEYVKNLCGPGNTLGCTPDYGWDDLTPKSCAPDVGAFETDFTENCTTNTNVPSTNISVPVD